MDYNEYLCIKDKKGQCIVEECGTHISRSPKELINNFFKAINSTLEWNEDDCWDDIMTDPKYALCWTKTDDGDIPVWIAHGDGYVGDLELSTTKGIEAFLKANDFEDISPEEIKRVRVGWFC